MSAGLVGSSMITTRVVFVANFRDCVSGWCFFVGFLNSKEGKGCLSSTGPAKWHISPYLGCIHSTNVTFVRPYARTNYLYSFFVPNVVHAWTNLPDVNKSSPCTSSFENSLLYHFHQAHQERIRTRAVTLTARALMRSWHMYHISSCYIMLALSIGDMKKNTTTCATDATCNAHHQASAS